MDMVAGFHIWVAEGYSAVRCLRCRMMRNGWKYYSPSGERYDGTPLCIDVPDVTSLILAVDNDAAWRAESEKL